jgi:N-formylglutamate deformylase
MPRGRRNRKPGKKTGPEKSAVFRLDLPDGPALCVVADSPHSGTAYPDDFGYACDLHELRKAEDSHVDKLYDFFPALGIAFLQAQFPRSYVDPNRGDAVTQRFREQGDGPYVPAQSGLVRKKCTPRSAQNVYDRPLTLREVFNRVAACHSPYHAGLKELLSGTHAREGRVVLLDCHSMPSRLHGGTTENPYDVIIGTRDGTTCPPGMAEKLCALFAEKGYRAGVNVPGFRGAEIVRRHGRPQEAWYSLQIELNRKLYMNEDTLEMTPAAKKLKRDLKTVMRRFARWCGKNAPRAPDARKSFRNPKTRARGF